MKVSFCTLFALYAILVFGQGNGQYLPITSHENMLRLENLDGLGLDIGIQILEAELNLNLLQDQVHSLEEKAIPIVFHVIHSPGKPQVTEGQVQAQLASLNRDFLDDPVITDFPIYNREYFSRISTTPEIKFCLPELPFGRNSAINFYNKTRESWSQNDDMKYLLTGGVPAWNTSKYLNVWVVYLDDSAGFAQMPGGPFLSDGIVIDARFFGSGGTAQYPYDEGKTLTHLVGNYLGLYSLWGKEECQDDNIYDTPVHNGPNTVCASLNHVSTCDGEGVELFVNFMDSTPDACKSMFTLGQSIRMQATLSEEGAREQLLITSVVCEEEEITEGPQIIFDEPELDMDDRAMVRVFPNPASDFIQVLFDRDIEGQIKTTMTDQNGRIIYENNQINSSLGVLRIDLGSVHSGNYFLLFEDRNGEVREHRRLIIIK